MKFSIPNNQDATNDKAAGSPLKGLGSIIVFENDDFKFNSKSVLFPLSLEKIARMYRRAVQNGFASYAEA